MTTDYSITEDKKVSEQKNRELDFIKQLDEIIDHYNKHFECHYNLRLIKALKRGWY